MKAGQQQQKNVRAEFLSLVKHSLQTNNEILLFVLIIVPH